MKTNYKLLILVLLISNLLIAQQWQNNISINNNHFQDLNTVQLQDGSDDYIIAGTLFDDSFSYRELFILRIENIHMNYIKKI